MKDVGTTLCTACGKVKPIMLFTSLHTRGKLARIK